MNANITTTRYDPREGDRDAAAGLAFLGIWGPPTRRRTGRPSRRRDVACIRRCFRATPLSLSQKGWTRLEKRHDDGSFT